MKYIISGGGTGGHIFPAISIANEISRRDDKAEILFVGAQGRMEMERVPAAGYRIKGLPVRGFDRKRVFNNIGVLVDLYRSIREAKQIVSDFNPDIAIGVGGYASAPVLKAAHWQKVPTLLQEQNSYAGVTNKLLAKSADKICVAYERMERYFPKEKIIMTGNPIRQDLLHTTPNSPEAYAHFGLDREKKTLLVVGGSLGAKTINDSIALHLRKLLDADIQVIWQTGKQYTQQAQSIVQEIGDSRLCATTFIQRMDWAYSIADVVVSRAGASSISELSLLGKSVILVPSPNVSEDHQTKNAMALVDREAALLVKDGEAPQQLVSTAIQLLQDDKKQQQLRKNIQEMAQKDAAKRIVDEVFNIIKQN